MKCLTWNLEWAPPATHRGRLIREAIDAVEPDVVCYTEVKRDFVPEGHRIEADSDYGYNTPPTDDRHILRLQVGHTLKKGSGHLEPDPGGLPQTALE